MNNADKTLWLMVIAEPKGGFAVHAHDHNCVADYRTNPFFCGYKTIQLSELED